MRGLRRNGALLILALGVSHPAGAEPIQEYFRSARAMGMGGAYIGVADDEDSLFLNPAGLAGLQRSRFNLFSSDFTVSSDSLLYARNAISGFGSFGPETINALMGQNHFAQNQTGVSITTPYFGLGYLFNGEFGIQAQNQALPTFTLINMQTHVFQGGLAYGFGRKKRGKFEFRVGASGKAVMRRGGYIPLQYSDIANLTVTYLDELVGPNGWGFGFDLGLQFVFRAGKQWTLMAGTAFTNLGMIAFPDGQHPIYGNLGAGIAVNFQAKAFHILFAADYKHILADNDYRKKIHLGLDLGLSWLRLLVGINQVYPTFGVLLDVWITRLVFSSYMVENGAQVFQDPERRWMLQTTFKIPL